MLYRVLDSLAFWITGAGVSSNADVFQLPELAELTQNTQMCANSSGNCNPCSSLCIGQSKCHPHARRLLTGLWEMSLKFLRLL